MRKHSKVLLAALTAALVLAAGVGAASARRLEVSSQSFRIAWSQLRFSNQTAPNGIEMRCPVTLEGTFHSRTISKVSGQLIGYITSARLTSAQCTFNGGVTGLTILNGNEGTTTTLPWHIRYDSFTGILPNITGVTVQIVGWAFNLQVGSLACLFKSTEGGPFFGRIEVAAGGRIEGLTMLPEHRIPRFSGSVLCPSSGIIEGRGTVTVLNAATAITVRLVL